MRILYFSDQWDDKWRRRQQFARFLAAKHELTMVEYPLPLTSLLKYYLDKADADATRRWGRVNEKGKTFEPLKNIRVITPIVPFKQFSQDSVTLSIIKRALSGYVENADKIIITHPFWGGKLFDKLGIRRFSLYDVTEDFAEITGLSGKYKKSISSNDDDITFASQAVVCVSKSLYEKKSKIHGNVKLIPNGVDTEKLNPHMGKVDLHAKYGVPREQKILLYVGGMNNRFDYGLTTEILKARPGWTLFVIGSYSESDANIIAMKSLPNCCFTGQVGLADAGKYINSADVCLIPHRVNELTKSQSTQKLYDYMALGKPIVASGVIPNDLQRLGITIAEGQEQWIKSIEISLSLPKNVSQALIEAVKSNDWRNRFEEYHAILNHRPI